MRLHSSDPLPLAALILTLILVRAAKLCALFASRGEFPGILSKFLGNKSYLNTYQCLKSSKYSTYGMLWLWVDPSRILSNILLAGKYRLPSGIAPGFPK